MKYIEQVYSVLSYKARFVPLSIREMDLTEAIQKRLGIEPCPTCEGVGGIDLPNLVGYGTEYCPCRKCKGLGEINHSEELKKELEIVL